MAGQQEIKPILERQFESGMIMRIYDSKTALGWEHLEKTVAPDLLGFPKPVAPNTKETGTFQK